MAKVADVRDGSEVSVETGIGWVTSVDEPTGRNAKVAIKAEHLQKPVMSWVDTQDDDLYATVRRLCEHGVRCSYRVVVKRKRNQPPDCPLDDIPSDGRIRDLEAVEPVTGVTAPPAAADPSPSTSTPPAPRTPSDALTCANCGGDLRGSGPVRSVNGAPQHVTCPDRRTTPDEAPPPVSPEPPTAEPRSTGTGPRLLEAKPWEFYNSDGSLNPGSYAYQAAEGVVLLANDLLFARARDLASTTPDGFKAPTQGQIRGLARRLLRAADRAQAALRDDGHVSRMANSHTRCRAAVRASLESYPVPWGATADVLDAWETSLADHAGLLLALTVELIEPGAE
jgi:hypothetical protein